MKCVQTSTGSCKSQPIKWKLLGSNGSPRDNSVSPSKPVPKAAGALFDYVHYWTSFVPTVTRGSFSNGDGAAKENVKKASRASLFFGRFLSCSLRDYDVKFWNLTFYQRRKRMENNCFVSLFLIWVRSPKDFNSSKIQIHLTDIANWNLKEREFTESFYSRRFFCRFGRRCISSIMSYFTYTNTAHLPSFEWSYFTVFTHTQSQEHIKPVFRIIVSTSLRSKIKHSIQRFITIWNGPKFVKKKNPRLRLVLLTFFSVFDMLLLQEYR